jgi:pyridoxine 5-phosphate synthase
MLLSINIDHIATLRNARGGRFPDPVDAARTAEESGADGIVCHLREDRRHIKDDDVKRLRKTVSTKLDLEMAATPEIIAIAKKTKPDLVTLVPERRQELTTEGGLDVVRLKRSLVKSIASLHASKIPVSLFIDPVEEQIQAAYDAGADMIEIHTGEYAEAKTDVKRAKLAAIVAAAAKYAHELDLGVNAGHGLDYANVSLIAEISQIHEMSIGHAVIVRAMEGGLAEAVKEMVRLVKRDEEL